MKKLLCLIVLSTLPMSLVGCGSEYNADEIQCVNTLEPHTSIKKGKKVVEEEQSGVPADYSEEVEAYICSRLMTGKEYPHVTIEAGTCVLDSEGIDTIEIYSKAASAYYIADTSKYMDCLYATLCYMLSDMSTVFDIYTICFNGDDSVAFSNFTALEAQNMLLDMEFSGMPSEEQEFYFVPAGEGFTKDDYVSKLWFEIDRNLTITWEFYQPKSESASEAITYRVNYKDGTSFLIDSPYVTFTGKLFDNDYWTFLGILEEHDNTPRVEGTRPAVQLYPAQ